MKKHYVAKDSLQDSRKQIKGIEQRASKKSTSKTTKKLRTMMFEQGQMAPIQARGIKTVPDCTYDEMGQKRSALNTLLQQKTWHKTKKGEE